MGNKLASKVVNQAKVWIGCKEIDGTHRQIIDVYNSHKPLARGYAVTYTDAWCATFVSACSIVAGCTTILPTECGCDRMIDLFKKLGEWVENDAYIPSPGDVVFYDWDDSGNGDNTGFSDHVGIVEACDGKTITVIEGNYSDSVKRRTLLVNGRYIRGFGVPKYDNEENTAPVPTPPATEKKTVDELAREVINGNWGNGDDRVKALTEAGYDYTAVQNKVNEILKGGATTTTTPATTTVTDAAKTIWDFLKGKGLNDFAVAGIMGNLFAESALRSNNLQNSYEKSLGYTDESYTKAVDNGTYTNFVYDAAGYGLVQWTYWSRKKALKEFADKCKASIGDLTMQLEFLWKELQEYTSVMNILKEATTILEASNAVLLNYERPADQSATAKRTRANYGQTYFDKYAGTTTTVQVNEEKPQQTPGKVTATAYAQGFQSNLAGVYYATTTLNLRNDAGTSSKILTTLAQGTTVRNYGYFTAANGVKWLYVQATVNNVLYTGFCSVNYLQKM